MLFEGNKPDWWRGTRRARVVEGQKVGCSYTHQSVWEVAMNLYHEFATTSGFAQLQLGKV